MPQCRAAPKPRMAKKGRQTLGKMRILHMTPPEIHNGVYQYLFNHMKYIDKDKYQFEFLTRNKAGLMETKEYRQYHFNVWAFENTQRDSEEGLRREITRILDDGFDAIHLHTSMWRGFLIEEIAMEMKIPQVIVHSHSTGADFALQEERDRLLQIHEAYKKQFCMEMATDVCACSRLAGEWLYGEQIPKSQIKILPNAVEAEKYHFNPGKRKQVRDRLGLDDRVIVGNVGRYSYQKNQEFLIRAFAKARGRNNKLFLILMGQGELKGQYAGLIDRLGIADCAMCMGWQEHVEDYLQAFDLFCLPSHFEGLSICAVEAQAAGLNCYLSDTLAEETRITDLAAFLPLTEEIWVEALAGAKMSADRAWYDGIIAAQGYDIRSAAGKLMGIYGGKETIK